jgi:Lipid A 3-O-deacylase (PagL)
LLLTDFTAWRPFRSRGTGFLALMRLTFSLVTCCRSSVGAFIEVTLKGSRTFFSGNQSGEHSGILGGGSLGIHYNFVQPGWRFVPYVGASLGISRNDLYVQQSQQIFGGPFDFVLQAKAGARYFISKNWGFMLEGGYEHVSNGDIYPVTLVLTSSADDSGFSARFSLTKDCGMAGSRLYKARLQA